MSKASRRREQQKKQAERLKDQQAKAARMQNPSGGSKYAKKSWNKDGQATGSAPGHTPETW